MLNLITDDVPILHFEHDATYGFWVLFGPWIFSITVGFFVLIYILRDPLKEIFGYLWESAKKKIGQRNDGH